MDGKEDKKSTRQDVQIDFDSWLRIKVQWSHNCVLHINQLNLLC